MQQTAIVSLEKWVKVPNRVNTFTNVKGDVVTFLNRSHALINGKQVLGYLNIYSKMLELAAY